MIGKSSSGREETKRSTPARRSATQGPSYRSRPASKNHTRKVNGPATGLQEGDLQAVVSPGLHGIVVPKSESADAVRQTDALLTRLEKLTLDHGGRIYLAKDAVLSPDGFRAMYPKLLAFQDVLDAIEPQRRLNSDMARRLKIREHGS